MKQRRALAFVPLRRAVRLVLVVERAVLVGLNRPFDVVRDEQVELAVVVIVKPQRAAGESRIGHAGFRGDIGKLAVAQIAEKMIRSDRGDVDVHVAIVVVVADGAALAIDFKREPGLPGDIRESPILIVVIERRDRISRFVAGPVHRVDQQNVLPAVVVVVEKAGAAAHGFRQVLFSKRAVVVFEADARLGGHIGEFDRSRRPRGSRSRGRCRRRWCWSDAAGAEGRRRWRSSCAPVAAKAASCGLGGSLLAACQ